MVFGGIFRGRLCRCSLLYSISYGGQSAAQGIAAFIGQISESFIHIFAVDVINAVERIEFLPTQPVTALNFGSQIGNGLSNLFTVCVGDFFFRALALRTLNIVLVSFLAIGFLLVRFGLNLSYCIIKKRPVQA